MNTCKYCNKEIIIEERILCEDFAPFKTKVNVSCPPSCEEDKRLESARKAKAEAIAEHDREFCTNIPIAHKGARLSDFQDMDIWRNGKNIGQIIPLIQRWINSPYWGLFLFSPDVGIGKTRLALSTAREMGLMGKLATGTSPYRKSYDVGRIMAAERFHEVQKKTKKLRFMNLLIIDDLGAEANPDDLSALIQEREENGKRTIITSNLSKDDITKRYGKRTLDRIRGGMFEMRGKSRRIQQ